MTGMALNFVKPPKIASSDFKGQDWHSEKKSKTICNSQLHFMFNNWPKKKEETDNKNFHFIEQPVNKKGKLNFTKIKKLEHT